MAELVRIYHPETNEPFDVIASIAERLRLGEGDDKLVWLSQPFTRVKAEEPASEGPKGRGRKRVSAPVPVEAEDDGWRDVPTEEVDEAA
uniref:Uncharacterized protein n=1 Tax=Caulobacter phage BL57 TaxID=3348355 RepID=A0AB74UGJ5_9VIRU